MGVDVVYHVTDAAELALLPLSVMSLRSAGGHGRIVLATSIPCSPLPASLSGCAVVAVLGLQSIAS